MNKITRVIAGGLTSIMAVGIFALPAAAVEPVSVEDGLCDALAGPITALEGTVADVLALILAQGSAVSDARDDMNASSDALGATGLSYIQALDGVGNVEGTLAAFVDSAATYSEDVTTWVDAVDEVHENTLNEGLNDSVLRYLDGLCVAVPAI
jgi:hypothetical protein